MEFHKIEHLLEKYFEGQTTIVEEKELQTYFSSPDVARHLEQYRSIFQFFTHEKNLIRPQKAAPKSKKRLVVWLSVAASTAVFLGIGTFVYQNYNTVTDSSFGTYDNPEMAFQETQKALNLLSTNVNVGVQSVQYIHEFDNSKNKIFKK